MAYAEPVPTKQEEMDQRRKEICDNPLVFPRRFYFGSEGSEVFDKYLREFDSTLIKELRKSKHPGPGYVYIWIELDSKGNLVSTKVEKSSNNQQLNKFVIQKIRNNSPYKPFEPAMLNLADEVAFLRSFGTKRATVSELLSDSPVVSKEEIDTLKKRYDDLYAEYKQLYSRACGRIVQ